MFAFLGALLKPFALKIVSWGAIALAVAGAALGVVAMIRKGAVAEQNARNMRETIERASNARRAEDRVGRMSESGVRDRLREWNRN